MKFLPFFAAVLLAAFLPSTLHARLAETEEEIEKRYGPPVEKPVGEALREKSRAYKSGGFNVVVVFLDGKSQCELFSKPDRSHLEDSEIEILLQANAFKGVWSTAEAPRLLGKKWTLTGGIAYAFYKPTDSPPMLGILTKQYADYAEEQKLQKQKADMKGF